jgi:hypothetical protein
MSGGLSLTPYENEKPKRGHHRRSGAEAAAKNGKGEDVSSAIISYYFFLERTVFVVLTPLT